MINIGRFKNGRVKKRSYKSKKDAKSAKKHAKAKGFKVGNIYKCSGCGYFHLTKLTTKQYRNPNKS